MSNPDLVVLFEHPEWQKPLFEVLGRRGVRFEALDLKENAFRHDALSPRPVYFNQASPSAYVRGNTRAVPFAASVIRSIEVAGGRVINGWKALSIELSKSTQAALITKLGLLTPRSIPFNDVEALARVVESTPAWQWPALIKPEQGGSGARIYQVNSIDEVRRLIADQPGLWAPDHFQLLQEKIPSEPDAGIIRMEFLDGELLYAMKVLAYGGFNLCPSEACNPVDGEGSCEIPTAAAPTTPVEFHPYPQVSAAAVEGGKKIVRAAEIDVGGIEFIETPAGPVFYDINANSNLRAPIGKAFGFDPFERVADYLVAQIELNRRRG